MHTRVDSIRNSCNPTRLGLPAGTRVNVLRLNLALDMLRP
jgi:K+-transporting ATPase c subunit